MKAINLLYIHDWMLRNFTNPNIVKKILDKLEKHSINMREFKTYFTKHLISSGKFDIKKVRFKLSTSLRHHIENNPYDNSIPNLFKIIEGFNDNLRYSKDGGETWSDIIFPRGLYDLEMIDGIVVTESTYDSDDEDGADAERLIIFTSNIYTGEMNIELKKDVQVDLTVPNSIGKTLGFKPQILKKRSHISEKKRSIYPSPSLFLVHPVGLQEEFNPQEDLKMKEEFSLSIIYNILDWLMQNLDDYIVVATSIKKLEAQLVDMTCFKQLYTDYLLSGNVVRSGLLFQEITKIQKKYGLEKPLVRPSFVISRGLYLKKNNCK